MGKSLDYIKRPIEKELIEFEDFFKESMKSNVALLNKNHLLYLQKKRKASETDVCASYGKNGGKHN